VPRAEGRAAAARVGAGIFVSRALGFVRERVFAHYFGSSDFADAWRAALRLPNVLRNLLGEGTLSASMIPVYAEFVEQGRDEDARRFAGAVLGILAVVAGAVVVTGVTVAPLLVRVFFPLWSPEKREITAVLVRILFPMVGIFVISAWAMGILDSHRRFFVSYVAPAMWNVAAIAAMVAGGLYWGLGQRDLVIVLAVGAVVGGALQLGLQLPFVLRYLRGMRVSLGRGVEGVSEAIHNFVPVVAARGVINVSGWFEVFLAGLLSTGSIAVMGYAQTFYVLPISLFGISVAASELPELSRMRDEDLRVLADRVSVALRRVAYFLVPSTIGYLTLGDVAIAGLFETGAFGPEQTLVTWAVLGGFSLGLPASAGSRALSSAFYALRDTRTPARIAYLRVAVALTVGTVLMVPLDRVGLVDLRLGAAGLALGASAGAWLEYTLLRRALGRRLGPHGAGMGHLVRFTLAAVLAAAVAVALQVSLPPTAPIVLALATLVPFTVVYLAGTSALGEGIRWRR
jgi:putative peptidoglycan lipid II flippase